jgi:adenosyl cobinamide kinase/adenosyl cobinamide phosphate guanylyltransferase
MITLVLGGTRSGKSAVAERLAASLAASRRCAVTYVATARPRPDDQDHLVRIARHRQRRPETWVTIEPDAAALTVAIAAAVGVVIVDSLGSWIAEHPDLRIDADALVSSLRSRREPTIVVSEEVGLSIHAPSELGRRFVDTVGELNQSVGAVASRVLLVIAGRAVDVAALGIPDLSPGVLSPGVLSPGVLSPGVTDSAARPDDPDELPDDRGSGSTVTGRPSC